MKSILLNMIIIFVLIKGMVTVFASLNGINDGRNTNFSFFWLAGKMILDGENPYDQTQYLNGHDENNLDWRPNKIFPYPLPLAFLCVPLGFFSLKDAFALSQFLSLSVVSLVIYSLLFRWDSVAHRRLLLPLCLFMFVYGPTYLILRTGSNGAFPLLIILAAIFLFEKKLSIYAGALLALLILKPPQGLPILILIVVWLFARKDWKAIIGIGIGGIGMLILGMLKDPLWVVKFRDASQAVMDRTLGVHSNVWAFSYLICNASSPCYSVLGAISALVLLAACGYFIWKRQAQINVWDVFNISIPIGFVSTVYLWQYDQILYVIPAVWIVGTLVQKTKIYFPAFIFLLICTAYSIYALLKMFGRNGPESDLWSLGNTLIILMGIWLAHRIKEKPEKEVS